MSSNYYPEDQYQTPTHPYTPQAYATLSAVAQFNNQLNHQANSNVVATPTPRTPIRPPSQPEAANQPESVAGSSGRGVKTQELGRTNSIWVREPSGEKRKAKGEDFRAEVEQRTRNGESCQQIAEALIARGVEVTDKSISRWRITWGLRKRSVRKQTKPSKYANNPRGHKSSKRTAQEWHRADITRMSQQGLSPEEIARIMEARGMKLKKGVSTILRLQTAWKLTPRAEAVRTMNLRHLARRKAREQQKKEFENYAKELGLNDPDAWVKTKMNEDVAKKLRQEQAITMMGDAAPKPGERKKRGPKTPTQDKDKSTGKRHSAAKDGEAADATPAGADEMDVDVDSDDSSSDELPAPTRTLRSGARVSTGSVPGPAGDDSDSSDAEGESDYPHDMITNNDIGGFEYPPLVDQTNDSESDDSSDSDQEDVNAQIQAEAVSHPGQLSQVVSSMPGHSNAVLAVMPPAQEITAMESVIGSVSSILVAAQAAKDVMTARSQGRVATNSMTGLPPTAADVEAAQRKLKDAARAILEAI